MDRLARMATVLLSAAFLMFAESFCVATEAEKPNAPVYRSGDAVLVLPDSKTIDFNQSVIYTAINFRWNNSQLDPWYMGNGEVMKDLAAVIDSLGVERILSVEVVSQSSPEGTLWRNEYLSQKRAEAMYDYMKKNFPSLASKLSVTPAGESWAQLRTYVVMDTLLAADTRDRVLKVLDADISVETRKEWMQTRLGSDENIQASDKDVYKYLLRTYYPRIRNSAIFIGYEGDRVLYFGPDIRTANAFRPIEETPERPPMEKIDSLPDIPDGVRFSPRDLVLLPREPKPISGLQLPDIPRPVLALKTNLLLDAAPYIPGYGWAPVPNIGLEFFPSRGDFSLAASLDIPWWIDGDNHRYFEARNWQLEGRWYPTRHDRSRDASLDYLDGSPFRGFFVYAYAHACLYALGYPGAVPQGVLDAATASGGVSTAALDPSGQPVATGIEGEGAGAGLGIGYALPLGRRSRWTLEFSAQAGYFVTRYDPYVWGDPVTGKYDGLYYFNWTGRADDFVPRQYRFTWLGPTRAGITLRYDVVRRKQKGSR